MSNVHKVDFLKKSFYIERTLKQKENEKRWKTEWKLEFLSFIFLKSIWYQEYHTLYMCTRTHTHIYITIRIMYYINFLQSSL